IGLKSRDGNHSMTRSGECSTARSASRLQSGRRPRRVTPTSTSSCRRYRAEEPRWKSQHDEIWRVFDREVRKSIAKWAKTPPSDADVDELVSKIWGSPVHGDEPPPASDCLQAN